MTSTLANKKKSCPFQHSDGIGSIYPGSLSVKQWLPV